MKKKSKQKSAVLYVVHHLDVSITPFFCFFFLFGAPPAPIFPVRFCPGVSESKYGY